MTRQHGLVLIASRKRALRVAKLASRTVRAILSSPGAPTNVRRRPDYKLSRRKRGFESARERHLINLGRPALADTA